MITFLWMLYLAVLIIFTYWSIIGNIKQIKGTHLRYEITTLLEVILALMWSIWYFYYLH